MTAMASAITADDVLQMTDAKSYELLDGTLVEAARTREARVFANDLGYQCFADDPDRFRKPDGSVVRRDRTAGIPNDRGYMPIPADLVVEVVSPTDLYQNVIEKVDDYLANGFPLVWVVDPNARSVTIYRAGEASPAVLRAADEITAEPALAAFRCKVAEFFDS